MSAQLLDCKEVAESVIASCRDEAESLRAQGIIPTLGILRVGEKGPDISYEKGATRTMSQAGIETKSYVLPADISQADYIGELSSISGDPKVHGILAFRPLDNIDENIAIGGYLDPFKDVDACTPANFGKTIMNDPTGLPPCTPAGIVALMDHYSDILKSVRLRNDPEYDPEKTKDVLEGLKVCVVNNSNIIGKPLFAMLTNRFATVSVIHHLSEEKDRNEICSDADVVIIATPFRNTLTTDMVKPGAVVIDAGVIREKLTDENGMPVINEKTGRQKVGVFGCCTPEVAKVAGYITPVPGMGSVTSAMLARNLIKACRLQTR